MCIDSYWHTLLCNEDIPENTLWPAGQVCSLESPRPPPTHSWPLRVWIPMIHCRKYHSKELCWLPDVSPVAAVWMVDAVMMYHHSWRKLNSSAQEDQKHQPACLWAIRKETAAESWQMCTDKRAQNTCSLSLCISQAHKPRSILFSAFLENQKLIELNSVPYPHSYYSSGLIVVKCLLKCVSCNCVPLES